MGKIYMKINYISEEMFSLMNLYTSYHRSIYFFGQKQHLKAPIFFEKKRACSSFMLSHY